MIPGVRKTVVDAVCKLRGHEIQPQVDGVGRQSRVLMRCERCGAGVVVDGQGGLQAVGVDGGESP